jgi:PIN domain nuclease of toxin-antitoxin system
MHNVRSVLLDTCALIFITEDQRIKAEANDLLNSIHVAGGVTYISPISAWEIGLLVARSRLQLLATPQRWFSRLLEVRSVQLAHMGPDLLIDSSYLPGKPPRDPADRIIAATARDLGCTLITRDRVLLDYGKQGHIHVVEC